MILVPLLLGLSTFVAFIAYERRALQPMLKLELFGQRNFAVGNVETLAMYAGLAVLFFFLSIFCSRSPATACSKPVCRQCYP